MRPRVGFASRAELELRFVRFERAAIWLLVGFLVVSLLDAAAWRWLRFGEERWLESRDWYQMLRQLGYLPVWIFVGVAYGLSDLYARRRGEPDRGPRSVMIILAPVLAGLIAEMLKRTIGRERPPERAIITAENPLPDQPSLQYVYKPFLSGWTDDTNMGIPSSHAAVAFGALVLLGFMHRGARPVFWLLAIGCAASRVIAGAHWLSDVYAGAVIGALCATLVWSRMGCGWSRDARDIWRSRGRRLG
ncbi:MAG: phosphatase PAP2 family protein [Phycisphaeraceae bacterium]|nr:phosphatase PAP2 family protein [Phycisphaeraceae bacterium]